MHPKMKLKRSRCEPFCGKAENISLLHCVVGATCLSVLVSCIKALSWTRTRESMILFALKTGFAGPLNVPHVLNLLQAEYLKMYGKTLEYDIKVCCVTALY